MYIENKTICAPATASGGSIGIIRISGPKAVQVLERYWRTPGGKQVDASFFRSHQMIYGQIVDKVGQKIDEVMAVYMKAPQSYTTEDIVEIQCHGGFQSMDEILETICGHDIYMAEPGEFTKRAFLHGRIDLSQAEAVMNVLQAQSKGANRMAQSHLSGKLGRQISSWRNELIQAVAHLEAELDYPEEMIPLDLNQLNSQLNTMKQDINQLLLTYDHGKKLQDGIKTVILGKPNVGKSSLLNALLETDRAIVTDIPGTTRDIIEAPIHLFGFPLILLDTAGIRDSSDPIEQEGVRRSFKEAAEADLIIMIFDYNRALDADDMDMMNLIIDKPFIGIINKIDLEKQIDTALIYTTLGREHVIEMSMEENIGLKAFKQQIENLFRNKTLEADQILLISSQRHKDLLERTFNAISLASQSIAMPMPSDIISIDLVAAIEYLGFITGESAAEDIIDTIFKDFCLGK